MKSKMINKYCAICGKETKHKLILVSKNSNRERYKMKCLNCGVIDITINEREAINKSIITKLKIN